MSVRDARWKKERDLHDETRSTHQHLIDLAFPLWRAAITEQPVEAQVRELALHPRTDPGRRFRKRFLPSGHVEVVVVAGRHDVPQWADRLDLRPERRVDRAGRVRQERPVSLPQQREPRRDVHRRKADRIAL